MIGYVSWYKDKTYMLRSYHRLVQLIDQRGLSLVLEHALDRSVIVDLCNTCGLSYAGRRTKAVPVETLASDLARACFDKEFTGTQVIKTLTKASVGEIDQIQRSKPERVRLFIDEKKYFSPRDCCRLTVAILLDERKEMQTTGADLLHKATGLLTQPHTLDSHAREDMVAVSEPNVDVEIKKQIHDLNQALINARNECGRLEKQNRIQEARSSQLQRQYNEIQTNYDAIQRICQDFKQVDANKKEIDIERLEEHLHSCSNLTAQNNQLKGENRKLRHQVEGPASQASGDAASHPMLRSVEKNIGEIKDTVDTAARTMEEECRGIKQTMSALQKEIYALRHTDRNGPQPVQNGGTIPQEKERIGIFVDVQNMFYAAKQYGARLDFEKLMTAAVGERRLVRAYAYVIQTPEVDQSGFVSMLQQRSYQVKRKDLRLRSDGSAKGDWDMGMAIDMIGMADKVDVVILVSGDGDFVSLLHLLKEMGPRVEVFSFPHNTARDLMETADRYYPIDEALLIKMEHRNSGQERQSTETEENEQAGRWTGRQAKKTADGHG
jgi:uncharacterized LabA/DUF88 family protein